MRRDGFTLLEVVLTIAIVTVMMVLLYGIVTATVRVQQRVEQEVGAAEIGPMLLRQIREDLEAVFQPDPDKEYFKGAHRVSGGGSWDRLDFLCTRMAYGKESEYDEEAKFNGVNEIGYLVQPHPEDSTVGVLHRRLDFFVDDDPLRGGMLTELYDRLRSFEVTYYDGKEWKNEWATKQREGKLPEAVRVELRIMVPGPETEELERSYTILIPLMKPSFAAPQGGQQPGGGQPGGGQPGGGGNP